MGRGKTAGGGAGGAPDWLGPKDEGDGAPVNRAQAREVQKEEKKRRPRRDREDEDLDKPEKKGIKVRVHSSTAQAIHPPLMWPCLSDGTDHPSLLARPAGCPANDH